MTSLTPSKMIEIAVLFFGALAVFLANYLPEFKGQEETVTQAFVVIFAVFLGSQRLDDFIKIFANRRLTQAIIDAAERVANVDIPDGTEANIVEAIGSAAEALTGQGAKG